MGYITIGMIALSAIAILFGMLYGMGRGRNRSILRLILILGCVAGAILLREVAIDLLMEIEVGPDGNLNDTLTKALSEDMPEAYTDFMVVFISATLSILVYFLIFIVLRIISWLIIFPICKIFVKREKKKGRLFGAIIGLVQGLVIIFAVLIPLNGLIIEVDKISQIEIEVSNSGQNGSSGEPEQDSKETIYFEIPEEVGLAEYADSGLCSFYDTIGGWYFDLITTVNTEKGKLNLSEACDVTVGMMGVVNSTNDIKDGFDAIKNATLPDPDKSQTLKELGSNISEIAKDIDNISDVSKEYIDDVISSVLEEEAEDLDISINDFKLDSLGDAFMSIGNYYENDEITQEEANTIVNGIVDNWNVIEKIYDGGTLEDMDGDSEQYLKQAISNLDANQKQKIMEMFGLS